jgi:hypothetical protein
MRNDEFAGKDFFREFLGHAGSPLVIRGLLGFAGNVQGDGQGGDSGLGALHGRGDRAGVGHIPAEVRAGVDPSHHQIRPPGRQPQNGQKHTVRRRTIGHMHDRAIGKLCGVNAEGFVEDPGARGRGPVLLRRQNPHFTEFRKNPPQGMEPRGKVTVVVGEKNEGRHGWPEV